MPDSLYPDLSTRERNAYSVQRLLAGMLDKKKQTGIEFEISDSIAKNMKRTGFFMPSSMLGRAYPGGGTAPAQTYSPAAPYVASTTGAALVGQEFAPGGFIAALRGKSRVLQLGATVLPGLVGNVAIPRLGTGAAAAWISPEGSDITESEASAMDQVRMTPKTVAGYAQATRQFIVSISPEAEAFLMRDLARGVAQAIDIAAIAGTGSNGQPLGILGTSGIGTVALGTNGGPITLAALEALEETVTAANVDTDDMAYLTTPAIVKEMRGLVDSANRPVWSYFPDPTGKPGRAPGALNGLPVARSTNVPSGLTKGTGTGLSAVLFGNWPDLLIGEWGVIELATNPYGAGFSSGGLELRVMATVDIAPRHPVSFAAITDAS
ncbi:phage major capsid protein [Acidiphilium sp. PA]|uniref:phage major capsid protein n=1 Tax=Acidiphilium sp. PA TaxID=2871705 RepID=UPI0022443400|nr:phage major capsid protein [Acidiphilium sp. PA]MCW8308391.1 phage major capsid protein [Acidiphilium sp. PA]